jgi:hypothetical protein
MIFALDSALITELAADPVERWIVIGRLLLAHHDGQHHLTTHSDVTDWLQSVQNELGRAERQVLHRLAREAMGRHHALLAEKPLLVRVGPAEWLAERTDEGYRVPWTQLRPAAAALATRLVAEQLDRDCVLYRRLAEVQGRARRFAVALEPQGGGGSQTGANLRQAIEEGRLCVGVVDADQRAPKTGLGGTAGTAVAKLRGLGVEMDGHKRTEESLRLARLLILQARTVENILPRCWLDLHLDKAVLPAVDAVLPHAADTHLWVNRKSGVECRKTVGGDAEAVYLRKVLAEKAPECSKRGQCERGQALTGEEGRCSLRILPGLGDKALQQVVAGVTEDSAVLEGLSQSPELCRIADTLADWGRAAPFRAA